MKRNAHVAVMLAGLGACSDSPVSPRHLAPDALGGATLAALVSTTNEVVPNEFTEFVSCANGGAGELVHVTGSIHRVFTTVVNANGGVMVRARFQIQGTKGVGLTTGDRYQASGVTQTTEHLAGQLPIVFALIHNLRLVGPGPDNNLLAHQVVHVTISANGVVTSNVDKFDITCR